MTTPLEGELPVAAPQATIPLPPPEALAYAQHLAGTLGETEAKPILQIARIVATLGPEETDALVANAQAAFAGEGVLTQDGSRKRNLGAASSGWCGNTSAPKSGASRSSRSSRRRRRWPSTWGHSLR